MTDRHLTTKALKMALKQRCPDIGLLTLLPGQHTYASEDYQMRLDAHGILTFARTPSAWVHVDFARDARHD